MHAKDFDEDLREMCCFGDIDRVTHLLESGKVDINSRNKVNGWTALHWAAKRGYSDICRILLSYGASTNIANEQSQLPIDLVSKDSHPQLVSLLSTCPFPTDDSNFLDTNTNRRHTSSSSNTPSSVSSSTVLLPIQQLKINDLNSTQSTLLPTAVEEAPTSPHTINLDTLSCYKTHSTTNLSSESLDSSQLSNNLPPSSSTTFQELELTPSQQCEETMQQQPPQQNSSIVPSYMSRVQPPLQVKRQVSSYAEDFTYPWTKSNSTPPSSMTARSLNINNGYTHNNINNQLSESASSAATANSLNAANNFLGVSSRLTLGAIHQIGGNNADMNPSPVASGSALFSSDESVPVAVNEAQFYIEKNKHLCQQGSNSAPTSDRILKVRVSNQCDKDFVEIDLPFDKLSIQGFLEVSCQELGLEYPVHIERIRKLPNTRIRRDIEVERLENYQELELVLSKHPISSPPSTNTPRHHQQMFSSSTASSTPQPILTHPIKSPNSRSSTNLIM